MSLYPDVASKSLKFKGFHNQLHQDIQYTRIPTKNETSVTAVRSEKFLFLYNCKLVSFFEKSLNDNLQGNDLI